MPDNLGSYKVIVSRDGLLVLTLVVLSESELSPQEGDIVSIEIEEKEEEVDEMLLCRACELLVSVESIEDMGDHIRFVTGPHDCRGKVNSRTKGRMNKAISK
jgi:hypothetical protein